MLADVRIGSKADMAALFGDVRFTPESGHKRMFALCQLPTLFDQFKNADIAAAVPFHQAFQQTVGLQAQQLRVALSKTLGSLEREATEDGLEPPLQIPRATFQQPQHFLPHVLEAGTKARL